MKHSFIVIGFLILVILPIAKDTAAQDGDGIIRTDPIDIQCGEIIESEFLSNNEQHRYDIEMEPGSQFSANVVHVGDQLITAIGLVNPTGIQFKLSDSDGEIAPDGKAFYRLEAQRNPRITSGALSARGKYIIFINNFSWYGRITETGGAGVYTLYVGCTLRDGTEIEPGDILTTGDPVTTDNPIEPPPVADFSGFGFPGLASVDFSSAIEIPLQVSTPQTAGIGNDVWIYPYEATGGTSNTLTVTRLSDGVSVGVVVINQDDNNIIFMGGMPYSDTLTAQLNFPTDGTYVIGLFRLDTPTLVGAGGAVQLSIE